MQVFYKILYVPWKVVSSTGASGSTFDVTFFTSPLDQNGGGTEMGQLPALYFRAPFTY